MLADIDYSQLAANDDPEEVRRMVLPRVFEILLAGGNDPIDETLIYPDGTVMIMMRKIIRGRRCSMNPIYVKDGRILTKRTIGEPPKGATQEINFCYSEKKKYGCHRGCGCGCLMDLGYIEWNAPQDHPHTPCNDW